MKRPAKVLLESVSKHYPTPAGTVRAVDGVTFEVEPRTSLAITGSSGCGKSTLLSLIGGLETPTSGRVVVGGEEVSSLDETARTRLRREIGFVFQSDNLLPFLTATENVCLQLSLQGAGGDHALGPRLLGALGMGHRTEALPDQLSLGQRQRVAVARAIVHRPGLILADEPTGSLDTENSAAVVELLVAAQRDTGATLIVVTHDPVVAAQLDRRLSLRDGRLERDAVHSGDPEPDRTDA